MVTHFIATAIKGNSEPTQTLKTPELALSSFSQRKALMMLLCWSFLTVFTKIFTTNAKPVKCTLVYKCMGVIPLPWLQAA